MRALSYQGPFSVKVTDKPDPKIEHSQDVVLRITRSAICGSDLHLLHGLVPDTRVGCTFGHEFAGVVEEVGKDVKTLSPGDRVVVPFNISCGQCFFCQKGLTSCCENATAASDIVSGAFGYSHLTGGYEGGQAQYVRVPYADVGPMKVPEDMTEEDVLFLSDIYPTGYQGAEMCELSGGETVVVFGAGPVGLFAMKSAWLLGAGRVIAVDSVDYRLEFARAFADVETVNFEAVEDIVATLREMTGGRGADAVIDAVGCEAHGKKMDRVTGIYLTLQAGSPTALTWAIQSVRKGGVVSVIGVYGPPFNLVPMGDIMNKGLTVRAGQCNVRRYMPRLLEHIREGRVDAKGVITHRFPLEEAPKAYHLFAKKLDGCVKCVLLPHGNA